MDAMDSIRRQGQAVRHARERGHDEPKKKYTVVHELVTQEKKKLITEIVQEGAPPRGYTFVPIGIGDLTEYCKERSREQGRLVYIVTATLARGKTNFELDRVGYHFENDVVMRGRDWLQLQRSGLQSANIWSTALMMEPSTIAKHLESHGKRIGVPTQGASRSQLLEQVRGTIKELFPKIPVEDLESVLTRAFAEDSKTVGNAVNLSLPKKVQLAVNAHIRHVHTPYEWLLQAYKGELTQSEPKEQARSNARADIEELCLKQLREWRGEAEVGPQEFEDIFREIIVIDDDEKELELAKQTRQDMMPPGAAIVAGKQRPRPLEGVNQAGQPEEDKEYEPPDIRSPLLKSKVSASDLELVHVRPRRSIIAAMSHMDHVANGRPGSTQALPRNGTISSTSHEYSLSRKSPRLTPRASHTRLHPDSAIESIEPATAADVEHNTLKRRAMPNDDNALPRKVYIIDDVPADAVVYNETDHIPIVRRRHLDVRASMGDLRLSDQQYLNDQYRRPVMSHSSGNSFTGTYRKFSTGNGVQVHDAGWSARPLQPCERVLNEAPLRSYDRAGDRLFVPRDGGLPVEHLVPTNRMGLPPRDRYSRHS